ncbi:hypothetical protein JM93_01980 [Roseibium hamelinense]|uniref:Uncharacterized protein n=1 Tax=Roseibium hamelinense TaxID=150831 RepID=A0A562T198_9HYPH|nr:hypothetical protein [Roseibium hamelinense]MTI44448.1 hypothetical protein [Roseibium hamelinense]TWI87415.1 hypothetical protein JM93_01980 [Roseibium hamelinense]
MGATGMDLSTTRVLTRLTTQFDSIEDRIRLSGETSTGPVVLWLTQRLARRAMPALLNWLEKQTSDAPMPELQQEMAQQAAESRMTPQEPVMTGAENAAEAMLVYEIDLGFGEEGARICFKDRAGRSLVLGLDRLQLRQWLGIVRNTFQKAEWTLDEWPEWSRTSGKQDATVTPAILH